MLRRRSRRTGAAVGVLLAALALGACEIAGPPPPGGASSPAPTSPSSSGPPPLTAGPPDESEVPPGFDQPPDGPSPTADADLPGAALTALLRTRSSSAAGDTSCGPADVTARLSGFDAALGHRYTSVVVTNTSSGSCVVDGVPGVGARGEWGRRLTLTVKRSATAPGSTGVVRLEPGAEAHALLEWTGELAGAETEHASLLVIQLASGQVPVPVPARVTGVPSGDVDLDVGMFTTIVLGPFEPRA